MAKTVTFYFSVLSPWVYFAGPRFAEWQTRFLQTVAAVLHPRDVAALPTRARP